MLIWAWLAGQPGRKEIGITWRSQDWSALQQMSSLAVSSLSKTLSKTLSTKLLFQQWKKRKFNREGGGSVRGRDVKCAVDDKRRVVKMEMRQINTVSRGRSWLLLAPEIIWNYSWKMTHHDSWNSPGGHWSAELPDELMTAWICVSESLFRYRLCFCVVPSFFHTAYSQLKLCLLVVEKGITLKINFLLIICPPERSEVRLRPCSWLIFSVLLRGTSAGWMPAITGFVSAPATALMPPQDTNLRSNSVHIRFPPDRQNQIDFVYRARQI